MQYIDDFFYFIRHGRVGGRTISENVRLQLEDASDATSDFPDVGTTHAFQVASHLKTIQHSYSAHITSTYTPCLSGVVSPSVLSGAWTVSQ